MDGAGPAAGVERTREITGTFQVGRHGALRVQRLFRAPGFIGSEGEQLVFDDRSADRSAVNMITDLIGTAVQWIRHGIEHGVPAEVGSGAVNLVCTRLHRKTENTAGGVPELRVDGVLLHGKLLHRIHGGSVGTLGADLQRSAVEQEVILAGGIAADVD